MQAWLRKQNRRARRFARRRIKPLLPGGNAPAPAPTAPEAPHPEVPPAPYSALNLQRLRDAGATYPGAIRTGAHPEDLTALFSDRYSVAHFVDHAEYQEPPADLIFAAVCNDKYAPGLEGLILSLLRVYPRLANTFVVYHDGNLSEFAQHRLRELYAGFTFEQHDASQYGVTMGGSYNHKRVGLLGYLTLHVLGLEEPSWVVVLDSDLLILGDISPLWQGDTIKAVPDIGDRPYSISATSTERPVLNSGVLSFPRSERGPQALELMAEVLKTVDEVKDPAIFRYADQKFWNLYLSRRPCEFLPQNFNTNKQLMTRHYQHELGSISVLHMTGPKPWYDFVNDDLVTAVDRTAYKEGLKAFPTAFALWNQMYNSEIVRARTRLFREQEGPALEAMKNRAGGRPVALIGNGPSLKETDLTVFDDFETVVFNWFVLHEGFDSLKPDHLVLPSHMMFGGWHTTKPELPASFIEALLAHDHKPVIWTSFYFKPYLETLDALKGYEIRYFLFEKPFKRRIAKNGWAPLDLSSPLIDCNTGVLTAGVPMALHFGATHIVLAGCDSNYASTAGSYFYEASKHDSKTTRAESLVGTWNDGGEGLFGYTAIKRELDARGVRFIDATVGGRLAMLERMSLEEVRALPSASVA